MTENVRALISGTFVAALGLVLAGCAHTPTGPSVLVLTGSGKTLEEFQRDDGACRASAAQDLATTPGGDVPAQRRYDITYMQCMYAKGHQIPVPGGRPSYTSSGSARPAPTTPERR
jgi:hypothetical protein